MQMERINLEDFAAAYGIPVALFPARWNYFGAQAGPIRNGHMAQYATHCICFGMERVKELQIWLSRQAKKIGFESS